MMKVFKMNDIDHVAAHSEQEAKEYYASLDGNMDDVNEFFEGEVNLNQEMYVDCNSLPDEEKQWTVTDGKRYGNALMVKRSFKWVLEHDKKDEPYIICSTEY